MNGTQHETLEALYTIHVVTRSEVNTPIAGLHRLGGNSIDDKLFTSEWLITCNKLTEAIEEFDNFGLSIKQFRVYKPESDKLCVVDWKLLQSAIDNACTIQV